MKTLALIERLLIVTGLALAIIAAIESRSPLPILAMSAAIAFNWMLRQHAR